MKEVIEEYGSTIITFIVGMAIILCAGNVLNYISLNL